MKKNQNMQYASLAQDMVFGSLDVIAGPIGQS
jgi:hypothetical protein